MMDWSAALWSSDRRFVDDEHVARGQQVTPLRPAMFEAGDRARRDARTFLQAFGGDARQRRAAHLQPGVFPSLARHAEHRALARPGIADDDSKPAPVRHTLERGALLTRKLQAALRCARQRPAPIAVPHMMPLR